MEGRSKWYVNQKVRNNIFNPSPSVARLPLLPDQCVDAPMLILGAFLHSHHYAEPFDLYASSLHHDVCHSTNHVRLAIYYYRRP
jgi:hypothetical protein